MSTEDVYDDLDDYDDDGPDVCDGCGETDGCCPMCCPNDGWYAPGTEECDFCRYEEECLQNQNATLSKKKRKE